MIENNKKVFVGVSGGVDSSVVAYLLKTATPNNFEKLFGRPTPEGFRGYSVTGVFIRTWTPEWIECTWREERRDAMRVCAHLGIPFMECDAEVAYKQGVADYMISEYKLGRTPNPDVMCNREVKFGVFWEFAKLHGADFIATGHYAQNILENGKYNLKKGIDIGKDQSYFLWKLNQDDLAHTLLPVGNMNKHKVRKIAEEIGLFTGTKKDSQGVCFLGPLDMKDFLAHYIKTEKGDVLNVEGEVIGYHEGALFYTLGERHGFTITKKTDHDGRFYVVKKDADKNTITVSDEFKSIENSNTIKISNTNWIHEAPVKDKVYKAQVRYHGKELECSINLKSDDKADVIFKENIPLASVGQSIVIYCGGRCVGGGIIA